MPLSPKEFRSLAGQFATGVTIITTYAKDGSPAGLTANSLSSVSLNPPMVLFCLDRGADCYEAFESCDTCTVNVLADGHRDVSTRFATKGVPKFEIETWVDGGGGGPRLDGALAHFECRVAQRTDGGDHRIYLLEVLDGAATAERRPLVFFQGRYRELTDG